MPSLSLKVSHTPDIPISEEARKAYFEAIIDNTAKYLTDTANIFLSEYWDNVNKETGRKVRSRRLSNAMALNLNASSAGVVSSTFFISGTRYLQWMANKLEHGGLITPTSAKVLTVRPLVATFTERFRYRARQYANAKWRKATPQEVTAGQWSYNREKAKRKNSRIPVLVQGTWPPKRMKKPVKLAYHKRKAKYTGQVKPVSSAEISMMRRRIRATLTAEEMKAAMPHVPREFQIIYVGRSRVKIRKHGFFEESVRDASDKFRSIRANVARSLEQDLSALKSRKGRLIHYELAPGRRQALGISFPAAAEMPSRMQTLAKGELFRAKVEAPVQPSKRIITEAGGMVTFDVYEFMNTERMLRLMKAQGLTAEKLLKTFR